MSGSTECDWRGRGVTFLNKALHASLHSVIILIIYVKF